MGFSGAYGPDCGELKYKLIHESGIQICRINHANTVVNKILNLKFMRRWETHQLVLGDTTIYSRNPQGYMECPVPYGIIHDIHALSRWEAGQNACLRIVLSTGSVLLQAGNVYVRDQWLHSLLWKRAIHRFKKLICNTTKPEVFMQEISSMIELTLTTCVQDQDICQVPLEIVSDILSQNADMINSVAHESIIMAVAPLLENNQPSPEICSFFSKHCRNSPRSKVVIEMFTPVIHRILKHNMDFGKNPRLQAFVRDFILAMHYKDDHDFAFKEFVSIMHGPSIECPHPRVLPNLVAICLASIATFYQDSNRCRLREIQCEDSVSSTGDETVLHELDVMTSFVKVLQLTADYDDWLPSLSGMLLPIPFPKVAMTHRPLTSRLKYIIGRFASDFRCEVHTAVCGVRDGKAGWLDLYCPSGPACDDEGQLFSLMIQKLISCCCRRRRFLLSVTPRLFEPVLLLALNGNVTCTEMLCLMLELDVLETEEQEMQVIQALKSIDEGQIMYDALCERQLALRQLQEKGGPKSLSLPSKSTDVDVAKLFSAGPLGNLESLNLAFTHVTSGCAETLIKLPNLKQLNLWSTQFGDGGLELITEHMHELESLNLCETQVTDDGLRCLVDLKKLNHLNLNSTPLTTRTFRLLTGNLPELKTMDTRYTDA
ncbi:C-Maf-inducing protein [Strongylocentrotus purpuratus]|uniref:C-Maf-inducing protein PH domain-containing protein n=1 Tax=Strongylocentrotus purpuratus TaxID=7668 RepID=A0A7M7SU80_STRPU|nr:C-Maf-inducing protein [Strongylocentrotus purpuratus]|eukprot:XP_011680649.1 PREDICTED: C-Maf-inducing protein [Strongylocentrotus purpuratus]